VGYVFVIGNCINCKRQFTFSPSKVPSIRVNGIREPVCKTCILQANILRKEKGMDPFSITEGAYEADNENEVQF